MKKFILITGGQASGKMTVGEELSKITGLKLFHNHMSVELAFHFYGYGSGLTPEKTAQHKNFFWDLCDNVSTAVLQNIGKSYLEGIITTFVVYFESSEDIKKLCKFINAFKDAAKETGEETEFYCVELLCDIEERKKRNTTQNRLEKKPSKRCIEWTHADIIDTAKRHRLVSNEQDIANFPIKNYLKIDNTALSAQETAEKIKRELGL